MRLINTNLLNYFYKNGVKPLKDALAKKFDVSKLANNLLTTVSGFALDARQGPVIQGEIDEINSKLSTEDVTQTLSTGVSLVGKVYTQNKRLYIQGHYKKQTFTTGWQTIATLPYSINSPGFQFPAIGWKTGNNPVGVTGLVTENKLMAYTLENGLQEITVNFSFPI